MDGSVDVWVDAYGCGWGGYAEGRAARGRMEGKGLTNVTEVVFEL
jgi:hypothetical protein